MSVFYIIYVCFLIDDITLPVLIIVVIYILLRYILSTVSKLDLSETLCLQKLFVCLLIVSTGSLKSCSRSTLYFLTCRLKFGYYNRFLKLIFF